MISSRFVNPFLETALNMLTNMKKIVSTDDYMPMAIENLDEYDKVINVSWYTPETPRDQLTLVTLCHLKTYADPYSASHVCYHSLKCTLSVVSTSGTSSTNSTFSLMTTSKSHT